MKTKLIIVLAVTLLSALMLAGCGNKDSKLEELTKMADASVAKVKISDYFKENQGEVEKICKTAKDELAKAKKEKEVEDILEKFQKSLKKIYTKEEYINKAKKGYDKLIAGLSDDKKAEAEELFKSFSEKMKDAKSKVDLDKMSKELATKMAALTGKLVEAVKPAESQGDEGEGGTQEVSADVKTTAASKAPARGSSSARASSSALATSQAPGKRQVWVVDKPAWNELVTKTRTRHHVRPTWWIRFADDSIKNYYDEQEWDRVVTKNTEVAQWGNGADELVPYEETYTETVNHPEEGHYEWQ